MYKMIVCEKCHEAMVPGPKPRICNRCSDKCGDCMYFQPTWLCKKGRYTEGKNDPVTTCSDFERENMKHSGLGIIVKVDGKKVPLNTISTETFEAIKALEKPKEIPVARVGNWPGRPEDRRLFLKISPTVRNCIIKRDVEMIAIDLENGSLGNSWEKAQQIPSFSDGNPYENIKPL